MRMCAYVCLRRLLDGSSFTISCATAMGNDIYSINKDTIIFTHFVVINSIIGEILKSDKIVNFQPSNCSITEIRKINDRLKLVKLGKSLESMVN